jgi:hypothetical protein
LAGSVIMRVHKYHPNKNINTFINLGSLSSNEDCQDISRNWFLFFGCSLRTLITTKTAKVNEGIYIVLGWYLWTLIATKTDKVNKGIYILINLGSLSSDEGP